MIPMRCATRYIAPKASTPPTTAHRPLRPQRPLRLLSPPHAAGHVSHNAAIEWDDDLPEYIPESSSSSSSSSTFADGRAKPVSVRKATRKIPPGMKPMDHVRRSYKHHNRKTLFQDQIYWVPPETKHVAEVGGEGTGGEGRRRGGGGGVRHDRVDRCGQHHDRLPNIIDTR